MAQLECNLCHFKGEENGDWAHNGDIHTCPACVDKWTCDNCQKDYSIYVFNEKFVDAYTEIFPTTHHCGQICYECEDEIEKIKKAERTIRIYVLPGGEEWTEGRPFAVKVTAEELQELKDGGLPKHLQEFYGRIDGCVDVVGDDVP